MTMVFHRIARMPNATAGERGRQAGCEPLRRTWGCFGFLLTMLFGTLRVAAADPVELIPGLTYLRVTAYQADTAQLATALAARRPLVVDLRYPPVEDSDKFPLEKLLAQRPSELAAGLFILVSPQTPAPLGGALQNLPRGVVTLGIADSRPAPAVIVAQSADTDRRAYDAWSPQIPLASLITGKIEKERFDEAALVKEFRAGAPAAAPAVPDPSAPQDEKEKAPVLTDRVLQRAVHLHRALLALRPRPAK